MNDVEGNYCGLFYGSIPPFLWIERGKSRQTSRLDQLYHVFLE